MHTAPYWSVPEHVAEDVPPVHVAAELGVKAEQSASTTVGVSPLAPHVSAEPAATTVATRPVTAGHGLEHVGGSIVQ